MLNFSKFVIFIGLIVLLPTILNIVDNIIKISNILTHKNYICDKIVQLSRKEFLDFLLEFFDRKYRYDFNIRDEDVYLKDGNIEMWLYYDNSNCYNLNIDDARKIIGLLESKEVNNMFIFTTRNIGDEVADFFKKISNVYNIKYLHKHDLNVGYAEFIYKFYNL